MKRWMIFTPVAAVAAFAAVLGLRLGQAPSETEIINRYAATYLAMAPEGARATDCAAAPHPSPDIRLVIICTHASGVETTFLTGPRGEAINSAAQTDAAI